MRRSYGRAHSEARSPGHLGRLHRGRFYATTAREFATHAAGQIVLLRAPQHPALAN